MQVIENFLRPYCPVLSVKRQVPEVWGEVEKISLVARAAIFFAALTSIAAGLPPVFTVLTATSTVCAITVLGCAVFLSLYPSITQV